MISSANGCPREIIPFPGTTPEHNNDGENKNETKVVRSTTKNKEKRTQESPIIRGLRQKKKISPTTNFLPQPERATGRQVTGKNQKWKRTDERTDTKRSVLGRGGGRIISRGKFLFHKKQAACFFVPETASHLVCFGFWTLPRVPS